MQSPLLMLLVIFATAVSAQTLEPPKIIKEEMGKFTNYRVEGSLASAQAVGCIPLAEASSKFTPPDLYKGVLDCLGKDNYESAAGLFSLAGVFARFDAERVSDKTAGQARTVMIMNTFANVPQERKERLNAVLTRITSTQDGLQRLCEQVKKVGMPNYYPSYMILHGIKAFSGNPHDGALIKDFDAPEAWKNAQSAYLRCPSAESNQSNLSASQEKTSASDKFLVSCPINAGDSVDKIKEYFQIDDEPRPSQTATGGPQYAYHFPKYGIWIFLDSTKLVKSLRFESPFTGEIDGVSPGDSLLKLAALKGEPMRRFEGMPDNTTGPDGARMASMRMEALLYKSSERKLLRYDVSLLSRKVGIIFSDKGTTNSTEAAK